MVALYMPVSPTAVAAMLAAARIGINDLLKKKYPLFA